MEGQLLAGVLVPGLEAEQLWAIWREVDALYEIWRAMHRRCENPKVKDYKWYGARGIRVCDDWGDFRVFLADMWPRPSCTSLDREDVNGNYEPGNVRWVDAVTQARNRRPVQLRRQLRPGEQFNRLTVVCETDPIQVMRKGRGVHHRAFICRCACGDEVTVKMSNLVYGQTKSCGCLRREASAAWMKELRSR